MLASQDKNLIVATPECDLVPEPYSLTYHDSTRITRNERVSGFPGFPVQDLNLPSHLQNFGSKRMKPSADECFGIDSQQTHIQPVSLALRQAEITDANVGPPFLGESPSERLEAIIAHDEALIDAIRSENTCILNLSRRKQKSLKFRVLRRNLKIKLNGDPFFKRDG
jgi:hypothetical protein